VYSDWQQYFRKLPENRLAGGHELAFTPEIVRAQEVFLARLVLCHASRAYLARTADDQGALVAGAWQRLVFDFFHYERVAPDELDASCDMLANAWALLGDALDKVVRDVAFCISPRRP
jgi:hypothetical protein